MKKFKNSDFFLIEKLRNKYAVEVNVKSFRELYSNICVEIPNNNDGISWDELNIQSKTNLEQSLIYKNKINIISKFLCRKEGKLLDIGFGNGFIERKLNKSHLQLFGIDISDKSVSNINKEIKGVFKKGTVLKIPFRSSYFDFVLLLDVLEHVSSINTFKALREINRVLKKRGYLIISVPLNEGLEKLLDVGCNPNLHVREYTPDILRFELELNNFHIMKEHFLYAFKKHYFIKSFITKLLLCKYKSANLYIVFANK